MLPATPSLGWTSSNPGWEFQAFVGARKNRPCWLAPQAPASSWDKEKGSSLVLLICFLLEKSEELGFPAGVCVYWEGEFSFFR